MVDIRPPRSVDPPHEACSNPNCTNWGHFRDRPVIGSDVVSNQIVGPHMACRREARRLENAYRDLSVDLESARWETQVLWFAVLGEALALIAFIALSLCGRITL